MTDERPSESDRDKAEKPKPGVTDPGSGSESEAETPPPASIGSDSPSKADTVESESPHELPTVPPEQSPVSDGQPQSDEDSGTESDSTMVEAVVAHIQKLRDDIHGDELPFDPQKKWMICGR